MEGGFWVENESRNNDSGEHLESSGQPDHVTTNDLREHDEQSEEGKIRPTLEIATVQARRTEGCR